MDKIITMKQEEILKYETVRQLIDKKISMKEVEAKLNLTDRQIRRLKNKVREEGVKGVIHKGRGVKGNRGFKDEITKKIAKIIKDTYSDFKPTLAKEKLLENHSIKISTEALRQLMITEKIWKPRKRAQPKDIHLWRPRKDLYGQMQQFDGSYHHWFENRGPEACLLASIDDATGHITRATFGDNEGVKEVFHFWSEYIKEHGRPGLIYLDKYSTYKINHKNATDNKDLITQFQRACKTIDIEVINAHSPQAKGRIERLFGTLQDRLIKEMRLRNISDVSSANTYLKEEFIPWFNDRFGVAPRIRGNAHRDLTSNQKEFLSSTFSKHSSRVITNDYTVRFMNMWLQLDREQPTTVYKKDLVRVEEHISGEIKVYHETRGKYLNFKILSEKPVKRKENITALTPKSTAHKPDKNHPWRSFQISKKVKTYSKLDN